MIMLIQSFQTYPVTGGFWTDGPVLQYNKWPGLAEGKRNVLVHYSKVKPDFFAIISYCETMLLYTEAPHFL